MTSCTFGLSRKSAADPSRIIEPFSITPAPNWHSTRPQKFEAVVVDHLQNFCRDQSKELQAAYLPHNTALVRLADDARIAGRRRLRGTKQAQKVETRRHEKLNRGK
jgi:hypothetical protein